MSRMLALEWDAREARVVVARRRGKSAIIEQAFAEPWRKAGEPAEGGALSDTRLGQRLAEMLADHGVRKIDTLVAVGRANIELRLLTLPPVPPEELPDIVRFQALKQFSSVGENWPIDFVPVESSAAGPINVLAAAISPDLVEQIRRTCAGAEVDPKRLVLRPYAAASLWQRQTGAPGCILMIDLLAEEVDLSVLVDGHVGFLRTVRLPGGDDADERAKWLSGEAKRTIAAAANQLGGRRAERVVFCGDNADFAPLRKAFEPLLNLPLELFDPFDGLTLDKAVADKRPEHRGRYAALLGMVVEEASGETSGVDFLNPRKAPTPPNHRRLYSLAAAAAAVIVLLVGYWFWSEFQDYDDRLLAIRKEIAEVDEEIKRLDKSVRESQSIDEFVSGDITWLDEIYRASDKFLPPEQAIVSQLTGMAQQGGGGQLVVEGHVKQSGEIDDLENRLRDALHRVSGSGGQFDPRQAQYPWQFKATVAVDRGEPASATAAASKPANVPAAASKTEAGKTEPKQSLESTKPESKPMTGVISPTPAPGEKPANSQESGASASAAKTSESSAQEKPGSASDSSTNSSESSRGPGRSSRGGFGRPSFNRGPRSSADANPPPSTSPETAKPDSDVKPASPDSAPPSNSTPSPAAPTALKGDAS
jgi:Tfp pilus assembly PilM family ATPase